MEEKCVRHLVFALARFEVEVRDIHLFEAQRAFLRLLKKRCDGTID